MYYNNYNRGGNNRNQNRPPQRTIDKDFLNPYAFIPLADRVYLLDDSEKNALSHDIPFQDSLSGSLTVEFESLTPFCVCGEDGHHTNVAGRYFIPGTSIKGMVRNVFEIVTMSNIKNGIANKRYSMRDLRNEAYELKATDHPQRSGFLIQLNGKFYIQGCTHEKWPYEDIEEDEKITGLKSCRSVQEKYAKLKKPVIEYQDDTFAMWFFSGFMNNKKHEYLFDIPRTFDKLIPLKEDEYNDFIFIHEKENENASWKFWKKRLKNYRSVADIAADKYQGIVPCFYRTKTDNAGEKCVKDLGFSYLYRQPYQKTIHEFLPDENQSDNIDMTQSVFGYVKGSDALKGRLQFEHAFVENARTGQSQTFILGSPKPTYYPFYLEQNTPGRLLTYFSNDTVISGYKRYLIHQTAVRGNETPSRVTKTFVPLAPNTKFTTVIHFHNLRDYELGALIAAITFCGKQSSCYHSLGIAKSFGYGKLKVNSWEISLNGMNSARKDYYQAFVAKICKELEYSNEADYLESIAYLFKIASGQYRPQKAIRYPNMNAKEFETIKNQKLSLQDFAPE